MFLDFFLKLTVVLHHSFPDVAMNCHLSYHYHNSVWENLKNGLEFLEGNNF